MRRVLPKANQIMAVCCLGIMILAGVTFAQQPRVRSVQQMVVEDNNGKTVGRVLGGVSVYNIESANSIDMNMRTVVVLQADQTLVPVMVGRDRFYGGGGLVYELENCSGIPFFSLGSVIPRQTDAPSLLPRTAIGPPGQTVYTAVPGAVPRAISKKSVLEFGRCSNETGNVPNAIPTQPLVDLLTVFTPPFTLKAVP